MVFPSLLQFITIQFFQEVLWFSLLSFNSSLYSSSKKYFGFPFSPSIHHCTVLPRSTLVFPSLLQFITVQFFQEVLWFSLLSFNSSLYSSSKKYFGFPFSPSIHHCTVLPRSTLVFPSLLQFITVQFFQEVLWFSLLSFNSSLYSSSKKYFGFPFSPSIHHCTVLPRSTLVFPSLLQFITVQFFQEVLWFSLLSFNSSLYSSSKKYFGFTLHIIQQKSSMFLFAQLHS